MPHPKGNDSSSATVLSMDLTDGSAMVVAIRCGPWRFRFLVDRDAPPGTLRELKATAQWVAARCAA